MMIDARNKEIKRRIREYIWEKMERLNIVKFPRPVYGRIPNFIGSEQAAKNLRKLKEWEQADTVFVNPDAPQLPVRAYGLIDGKRIIMATPRLRRGLILLNPNKIADKNYWKIVTIKSALKWGETIHPSKISIDIKVTGSVAVDINGGRLGKGHGYSDLEYAILKEFKAINDDAPVVTTVHDVQIVDYIPMSETDLPVDLIITPTKIIRTNTKYRKPKGIIWDLLNQHYLNEIPLLKEIRKKKVN